MKTLKSLKSYFITQLENYAPEKVTASIQVFQHKIANFQSLPSLLSWLKGQVVYPQYYLHLRDTGEKLAAIGQVLSFNDLSSAQHFITQNDHILLGGLTFQGDVSFFLPRILLQTVENDLFVRVFLDLTKPLAQEKQAALAALEQFEQEQTLLPVVKNQVQLIEQSADQTQWCHWIEQALDLIAQQQLSKIVLANQMVFALDQPINSKDLLAESEKQNLGCYHFLFAQNTDRTFIGSTPERLYWREQRELKTEALAGTAAMTENVEQNQQQADWLLNDVKNDYENQLVVQDITAHLAPYTQKVEVSEVEVKQLRKVQHLRRKISAKLTLAATDYDCLHSIHPTAAIAGLPRKAAKKWLSQIENFDRSWYAGTLGFMQQMKAEFCVTLRSAFVEPNKISVFAGAGIVEGSVPLLEWQEIERKALGLVSLISEKIR